MYEGGWGHEQTRASKIWWGRRQRPWGLVGGADLRVAHGDRVSSCEVRPRVSTETDRQTEWILALRQCEGRAKVGDVQRTSAVGAQRHWVPLSSWFGSDDLR